MIISAAAVIGGWRCSTTFMTEATADAYFADVGPQKETPRKKSAVTRTLESWLCVCSQQLLSHTPSSQLNDCAAQRAALRS
jgi:hypothetical protein